MEVKPLQTLLILIFFGGLLGFVMWSGMQARLVQGPSDLRVDGLDRLHIRIHDKVFVYDAWFDLLDEYALVESDWDVLARQQDLHGGAIDRNDARSLYLAHTSVPAGSEPPPMTEFGGDVVVADYAGMAVAIGAEIRKAKRPDAAPALAPAAAAPTTTRPHPLDPHIHWLEPKRTLLWLMLTMAVLLAVLPLVAVLQIPRTDDIAAHCVEMTVRLFV